MRQRQAIDQAKAVAAVKLEIEKDQCSATLNRFQCAIYRVGCNGFITDPTGNLRQQPLDLWVVIDDQNTVGADELRAVLAYVLRLKDRLRCG